MKNMIWVGCFAALALAGCSQEDLGPTGSNDTQDKTQLTLVGEANAETRISLGDETDGKYPVLWQANDVLGLFSTTEGAFIDNLQAVLTDESAGLSKGTFTAEGVSVAASGETTIYVYYPYSADAKLDGTSISSSIAEEQSQSAAGDSRNLGKNSFAYAQSVVTAKTTSAQFTLSHPMAYVKFVVSSNDLANYKLKSVTLYDRDAKTPLSGSFSCDLATGTLTLGKDTQPYATVSLETSEKLSTTKELYLTTLPAEIEGKNVYVVVTLEGDDVTIPILKKAKALRANTVSVIAVNDLKLSDNACDWYEPVETRLLVDGWAYGETNCIMTDITGGSVDNVINVKARGKFTEVTEPKYAKVSLNCDLNNNHKMIAVGGSNSDLTPVASDYTITVTAAKVTGGYNGGCGQVSIYGEDGGTIIWSYIIWMTPTPAEHTYGTTGYVVLDRNIGAYNLDDNWKTNGVYFQWGRPTPFGWGANGYNSMPTEATNVRFSIENPRYQLITNGVANTHSDWYLGAWTGARTDRKDDFWGNPNESSDYTTKDDGHKSIYDPCPKGYRVVSPAVLEEVENNGTYYKQSSIGVIRYCYDGTNYALWPMNGCRWGSTAGSRTTNNTTTAGCYWSNSTATGYSNDLVQGARCLYYQTSAGSYTYQAGRSHAFAVRCMKDTENR
jgi:hypothetical protein